MCLMATPSRVVVSALRRVCQDIFGISDRLEPCLALRSMGLIQLVWMASESQGAPGLEMSFWWLTELRPGGRSSL